MITAYGNGDCVKIISVKAWWLLAVYQGFYLGESELMYERVDVNTFLA